MGRRKYDKDHLKELAPTLVEVELANPEIPYSSDFYNYWTKHPTLPVKVSLDIFRDGEAERSMPGGTWSGPMSGRPRLIEQIAPVLKEIIEFASYRTIEKYIHSFRTWWRIFDHLDQKIKPVETVADLTEIHRQYAIDQGIHRIAFSNFVRVVNVVRRLVGLPHLHWFAPTREEEKRYLPPEWQVKAIRVKLKHEWFKTLFRWDRADELMSGSPPLNEEEKRLLANYQRFDKSYTLSAPSIPGSDLLWDDLSSSDFNARGYNIQDMLCGRFPDAYDIRIAFHTCLATTGWNPSVLLGLDINKPFIQTHPKDERRYLMWAHKERGDSEQQTEGLWSSRGSAGSIIKYLMERTKPLRVAVKRNLRIKENDYKLFLKNSNADSAVLDQAMREIIILRQIVRSPWLYVTSKGGINALTNNSYHRRLDRLKGSSFAQQVVDAINATQPLDRQVSAFAASDFRDAFGSYAYQLSGGSVLYVKKVLGHRYLSSTQRYIKNTRVDGDSETVYRTFSNALWHEIKFHKRVDPTLLARWCRDGEPSESDRERLNHYRGLKKSRIGVGCKDPANPPARIAPGFETSRALVCNVQRCTLCVENAVIFPESLDGLCKRQAELEGIQTTISVTAFLESSFDEELSNTRLALEVFDQLLVENSLHHWRTAIADGRHRIVSLEGI